MIYKIILHMTEPGQHAYLETGSFPCGPVDVGWWGQLRDYEKECGGGWVGKNRG